MTTKTDIVPVPDRRLQAGLWAASLGREAVTYQLFMLPSGLSVTALAEVLPPEQWAAIESTCNDLEARGLAIRAGDPETVSLTEQGREHACVVDPANHMAQIVWRKELILNTLATAQGWVELEAISRKVFRVDVDRRGDYLAIDPRLGDQDTLAAIELLITDGLLESEFFQDSRPDDQNRIVITERLRLTQFPD